LFQKEIINWEVEEAFDFRPELITAQSIFVVDGLIEEQVFLDGCRMMECLVSAFPHGF
jgi:hypothetical protein